MARRSIILFMNESCIDTAWAIVTPLTGVGQYATFVWRHLPYLVSVRPIAGY